MAKTGMAANHEDRRQYAVSTALLFERCRDALSECGFTIERVVPAEGRIEASAGVNWKSFGETIELTVQDGTVHVRSSCKVSTTVFDFGLNRQNVEAIFRALESSLARRPPGGGDTVVAPSPSPLRSPDPRTRRGSQDRLRSRPEGLQGGDRPLRRNPAHDRRAHLHPRQHEYAFAAAA
ncbi:MAG TPA: DUF1499 domain-containing protein, partial [Thauera sp.]|nr:DUF1499 domain-containing protein [Thauera sp.]